jgi:hypothetical protein
MRSLARLVDKHEDAQIVLTVLGRDAAQATAGAFGAARDRMMKVRFEAGSLDTEMTASAQGGVLASGGAWGKAAGKIAKQVEDWVKENGKTLQASTNSR